MKWTVYFRFLMWNMCACECVWLLLWVIPYRCNHSRRLQIYALYIGHWVLFSGKYRKAILFFFFFWNGIENQTPVRNHTWACAVSRINYEPNRKKKRYALLQINYLTKKNERLNYKWKLMGVIAHGITTESRSFCVFPVVCELATECLKNYNVCF